MNFRGIFYYLGWLSLPISLISLLNIIFCYSFSYKTGLNSYFYVLILSLIFFLFTNFKFKKYIEIKKIDKLAFIIIGWFLLPIFILIPYLLSSHNLNLFSSYYESVSGFTGFGFSIFNNPVFIIEPLLLWRSFSQWVGGFYYLVTIVLVLSSDLIHFKPLNYIKFSKSNSSFKNNFFSTSINILYCYILLSLLVLFILNLTNLNFFEKFNLMLSSVSSGGFYIKNYINIYHDLEKIAVSICFLLSSFNIFIFYYLFKKDKIYNFKEDLNLSYLAFSIPLFLIIFFPSKLNFIDVFFSTVTSLSNSGLDYENNNFLFSSLIVLLVTFVGGSILSTTSGFKLIRLLFFIKKFSIETSRLLLPSRIIKKKIFGSKNNITNSDYFISVLIFIFYFILFIFSSLILSFDQLAFSDIFKFIFLTLNNTLPTNYLDNSVSYADLNVISNITILFLMIFSKAFFISILVIIKNFYWNR